MQIIPPDIGIEIALLRAAAAGVRDRALPRAMLKCGMIAKREAIRNAPRSPTQSAKNNLHKTSRRRPADPRSTGRAKPGGLERAISMTSGSDNAEVFVATNSEAGKYAYRIHEEKGITWHERGPGTIAKGGRADEKFISRALADNAAVFLRIIKTEFEKVVP
jgi:hypothetical protein